eukprot:9124201-Pyramimonas_sp.AAC.1
MAPSVGMQTHPRSRRSCLYGLDYDIFSDYAGKFACLQKVHLKHCADNGRKTSVHSTLLNVHCRMHTVELTVKTLLSHLITRKFNSPTNSSRTSYVRVSSPGIVGTRHRTGFRNPFISIIAVAERTRNQLSLQAAADCYSQLYTALIPLWSPLLVTLRIRPHILASSHGCDVQ